MSERHGGRWTPEYTAWLNMKTRCNNPNHDHYKDYGGRGIRVSRSWSDSFAVFRSDMGKRPDGHILDRVDVNGNYEPANCRWQPAHQKGWNTRNGTSPELVREVRRLHRTGLTRTQLATRFQRKVSTIRSMLYSWKTLNDCPDRPPR